MDTKVCNECNQAFPIDIFIYGRCRPCVNRLAREKQAILKLDPIWRENRNAKHREFKRRNPRSNERRRKEWLKYKYSITPEDYKSLLDKQNGVCAICYEACKTTKGLAVDHDHRCCPGDKSCGKCIRGLLCSNCNGAIGMLQENISIFNRAIEYLS
jgi:hypothetical protein